MAKPRDERILEDLTGRYATPYALAIQDMIVAAVDGDRVLASDARRRLVEAMRASMGVAEVVGATSVLRKAATAFAEEQPAARFSKDRPYLFRYGSEQDVIPRVTFDEAIEDMVSRTPVTIRDAAQRTGARVAELYSGDRVVAFAKSAEDTVTKAAQDFIVRALKEGVPGGEAGKRLALSVNKVRKETEAWSDSYARTVFRTNFNTAVTAGRFRQIRDPEIKAILPAFQFLAAGDGDTRDNHMAGHKIVLASDSKAWNRIAPPLGHNCRCRVLEVTRSELGRMGKLNPDGSVREDKVPAGLRPDPGFRHMGRPDLFLNG